MNIHLKKMPCVLHGENGPYVKSTDVFIGNDSIISVGEAPVGFVAQKIIEGKNKLAIPGLINAHTHSYMSVMRNYADDIDFDKWLFGKVMPKENMMNDDDAYWSSMLACCEMLKTGATCFCDMHMFPNTVAKAVTDTGIRAVLSRGLADGDDPEDLRRLNEALAEIKSFSEEPLLSFMLAPHAIYTCEKPLIQLAIEEAEKLGIPVQIHLSETAGEVENCLKQNGCTPVEYLNNLGFFDVPCLLAHCVHVSDGDIAVLAEKKVNIVTNPVSNLKLGNGVAPVKKFLDAGINVCIGTDSAASNNSLNMIREMNFAALIHKGVNSDPCQISAREVFDFATINAAAALGLSEKTGEIKAGVKADITVFDTDRAEFYPHNDLLASLCYSANGSEADTVIVNGEIVLEGGRLKLYDEQKIYAEAERVKQRLGI